MRRNVWILALLFLAGCGEPEQSHFVPASQAGSGAKPADRRTPDKFSRETTVPKNIEMH